MCAKLLGRATREVCMPRPKLTLDKLSKEKPLPGSGTYATYAAIYLLMWRDSQQNDLAAAMRIQKATLSQILKGTRAWSPEHFDSAARFFGLEPDEFLQLGRRLYNGEPVVPYPAELKGTASNSAERLTRLFKMAAKGNNALEAVVSASLIEASAPRVFQGYIRGEYTDGVIYEALRDTVSRMEKDPSAEWFIQLGELPPSTLAP